jgi:hypothetical protein
VNRDYGFKFSLPESWKGYSVVAENWEADMVYDSATGQPAPRGPEIILRHPAWTAENPRQDIPLMVFSLAQWEDLQQDKFYIGAAPVNPSGLGRNNRYVFALPARYNFAASEGVEEVETIMDRAPLSPFDI